MRWRVGGGSEGGGRGGGGAGGAAKERAPSGRLWRAECSSDEGE